MTAEALRRRERSERPVALITGASRGIGRGIALELAKAGAYDLIVNYASNEEAARQTAADCRAAASGYPMRVELCRADVSAAHDRERLVDCARRAFGRLDLLVNNAGVAPRVRADILEASEESFDRLIGINLKGPYFLTQVAAKYMIEPLPSPPTPLPQRERGAGAPPGMGKNIVNINSISAFTASVNRGDYCVSKAGLAMATKLWAARLAEYGIGVFEIQPGIIATDMTAPVQERYDRLFAEGLTPIARWGTPEDVGRGVVAIAQGQFPYSTGQVIYVDGGFHIRRL